MWVLNNLWLYTIGANMENQNEPRFEKKDKQYRVIRQYHNKEAKVDYDLYMNLKSQYKSVTVTKTRTIVEGVNTSEFVIIVEDDLNKKYKVEYWKGQRDVVSGVSQSKRQFVKMIDDSVIHLFVSEITQNCFAIPNNSENVGIIADKVISFVQMQDKGQESL